MKEGSQIRGVGVGGDPAVAEDPVVAVEERATRRREEGADRGRGRQQWGSRWSLWGRLEMGTGAGRRIAVMENRAAAAWGWARGSR